MSLYFLLELGEVFAVELVYFKLFFLQLVQLLLNLLVATYFDLFLSYPS